MKTLLVSLLLSVSLANAQYSSASNAPDCFFSEILTTVTNSASFDNRSLRCAIWQVQVINLSNASSTYVLEYSDNNSSFYTAGSQAVAATSGNTPSTISSSNNYLRVKLLNKGTGNVIVAVSGFAYQKRSTIGKSSGPDPIAYTLLHDPASATISYYCKAKSIFDPNTNTSYPVCAIYRITYNATPDVTLKQWADGDTAEDNIWANRAALTYK